MNRTEHAWVAAEVVGQPFPKVHLCRDDLFDRGGWAYAATRGPAVCGVRGGFNCIFRIIGTGFGSLRVVSLLADRYGPHGTLYARICPTCLAAWRRARKGVKALPGDPDGSRPDIVTGVSS